MTRCKDDYKDDSKQKSYLTKKPSRYLKKKGSFEYGNMEREYKEHDIKRSSVSAFTRLTKMNLSTNRGSMNSFCLIGYNNRYSRFSANEK